MKRYQFQSDSKVNEPRLWQLLANERGSTLTGYDDQAYPVERDADGEPHFYASRC